MIVSRIFAFGKADNYRQLLIVDGDHRHIATLLQGQFRKNCFNYCVKHFYVKQHNRLSAAAIF
jgi:hypothetical protein